MLEDKFTKYSPGQKNRAYKVLLSPGLRPTGCIKTVPLEKPQGSLEPCQLSLQRNKTFGNDVRSKARIEALFLYEQSSLLPLREASFLPCLPW